MYFEQIFPDHNGRKFLFFGILDNVSIVNGDQTIFSYPLCTKLSGDVLDEIAEEMVMIKNRTKKLQIGTFVLKIMEIDSDYDHAVCAFAVYFYFRHQSKKNKSKLDTMNALFQAQYKKVYSFLQCTVETQSQDSDFNKRSDLMEMLKRVLDILLYIKPVVYDKPFAETFMDVLVAIQFL